VSAHKRCAAGRQATAAKTNRGRLEALVDGNGKGSDDDINKGNKKDFPKGGGRRWSSSSS
jgi:hypothetical protein